MGKLFGLDDHDWKQEWQDMPEFVQDKKEPYAKINIRFDNEEDLQEFAKLINQNITKKQKVFGFHLSHIGV